MDEQRKLTLAYLGAHPAEAAGTLDAAPCESVTELLAGTPVRIAAPLLAEMSPPRAAEALQHLPPERMAELFAGVALQASIRILRHLPEALRLPLIERLPTASGIAIRMLLRFPRDSVGAAANPAVIAIPAKSSVADALAQLRAAATPAGHLLLLDAARRLVGWVTADVLLRTPESARLASLAASPPALLPATMPLAGAMVSPAWSAASILPVVDRGGRPVGLLTHDAMTRAAARLARDTPVQSGEDSLAGLLARSYLLGVVSLLQAGTFFLPRVPAAAGRRDGD